MTDQEIIEGDYDIHSYIHSHVHTNLPVHLSLFLHERENLLWALVGFLINKSQHMNVSVLYQP